MPTQNLRGCTRVSIFSILELHRNTDSFQKYFSGFCYYLCFVLALHGFFTTAAYVVSLAIISKVTKIISLHLCDLGSIQIFHGFLIGFLRWCMTVPRCWPPFASRLFQFFISACVTVFSATPIPTVWHTRLHSDSPEHSLPDPRVKRCKTPSEHACAVTQSIMSM